MRGSDMELYKRIRNRREELGMSQDELAKKMGYKSRSSINKIEMGENDIPQSKISAFAKALNVDEAWLMGYDTLNSFQEDPNIIKFDDEIDEIIDILTKDHYKVNYSPNDGSDAMTILDSKNNIVTCIRDFELVNIYESLKRSNTPVTSQLLLNPHSDPVSEHMETFAYRHFGIDYISEYLNYDCTNLINSLSLLNNSGLKEAEKRIAELQYIPQYKTSKTHDFSDIISFTSDHVFMHDSIGNKLNAAHARTDVKATQEDIQHDLDIMDDDSKWD